MACTLSVGALKVIRSQRVGNTSISQYMMIILADTAIQTDGLTDRIWVDSFSSTVNQTIEAIIAISILRNFESVAHDKLHENITGITGSTQGASILNIPDIKEITIRIMTEYIFYGTKHQILEVIYAIFRILCHPRGL